ncbi:MAG: DUF6387 family protein [Oscillospiraceae bacterium]
MNNFPDWFNLKNYQELNSLSAKDWLVEISFRFNTYMTLTTPKVNFLDLKNENLNSSLEKFNNELQKQAKNNVDIIKKFGLISKINLDDDYNKTSLNKDQIEIIRSINLREGCSVREIKKDDVNWLQKVLSDYDLLRPVLLEVNLDSSNERILTDFNSWLKVIREKDEKSFKYNLSKKEFDKWAEHKIVPYWDLENLTKIDEIYLPYQIIGEAIFPDEIYNDVELKDRVRITCAKYSREIFSYKTISKLNNLINFSKE